jgi:XrtJ-associated TM-motif-TM protein
MIRRQEGKVSKLNCNVPVALLLLMAATAAHAQGGGCVDSPENPTVVFGLIAAAASVLLVRLRSRNDLRNK